jgi:DNA-binding NarL/FixJ family response regulator
MRSESLGRIDVLVWLAEPLLRAGVQATLRDAEDLRIVDRAQLANDGQAHVVVTDWACGLQFAQHGSCTGAPPLDSHSRILIVSSQAREHAVASALQMGVHGLVLASCTAAELLEAIQVLAQGRSYVCAEVAQRMAISPWDQLTAREDQVLQLLARGQCNKTIARQLGIAVGTVKTHVKGIMAKLEATSRTEAASIAAEKGIVGIPEFRSRRASWSPSGLLGSMDRAAVMSGMQAA